MLRKFKISIDGKEYLVEMEEIGGVTPTPAPTPQAPVAPVAQVAEPQTPAAPVVEAAPVVSDVVAAGDDAMTAPMPGTILRILVNPGESVTENQPLMILEAMKMENEVVANRSGIIKGIHVTQGQMVNPGDALVTIG